jgi:SAM-dependent methyltransferase
MGQAVSRETADRKRFQYRFIPGGVKESTVKGQEWYQADEVAEAYEDKRFSRGGRLIDSREKEAVLSALGPVEDKEILEIACGTGRFTAMLAERGADIIGLDISGPMLQQGRQKAQSVGVEDGLEFMRGDAGRLPFPDNSFDIVFAMRFFHLADTPETFLKEMCRVSREQIFFDTFNGSSSRSLYNWALPMGSRLYSGSEVHGLLDSAGLQLVNAEHDWVFPYGFYRKIPNSVASVFRTVDKAVHRTPLGKYLATVSYWNARLGSPDR